MLARTGVVVRVPLPYLLLRVTRRPVTAGGVAVVKAAYDVTTYRDPVFLGRHETGVEDALS